MRTKDRKTNFVFDSEIIFLFHLLLRRIEDNMQTLDNCGIASNVRKRLAQHNRTAQQHPMHRNRSHAIEWRGRL